LLAGQSRRARPPDPTAHETIHVVTGAEHPTAFPPPPGCLRPRARSRSRCDPWRRLRSGCRRSPRKPYRAGLKPGATRLWGGGSLRCFANLKISRGAAAPPTLAARPGTPPSVARPAFPGSLPTPPFVRAPPYRSECLQLRRLSRRRRSVSPRVVSQAPSPFGGPPATASQASSPFVGHSIAASQGEVPHAEGRRRVSRQRVCGLEGVRDARAAADFVACGRCGSGGFRGSGRAGVRDVRRRRRAWGRSVATGFAGAGSRAVAGGIGCGGGSLQ
jgi:hypothetical protein